MYLFHQNMRRFGGGSVPRRNAYNNPGVGGFATINGALAPAVLPLAVAGFTEITNNGASNAALVTSSTRLGGVFVGNVACGITALARGYEYIGLARNAAYALVTVGRVLFQIGGGVALLHQRAATAAALNAQGLPFGTSADYRGLVYCIVAVPAVGNIAVGYLHNMYTFQAQRTIVAGQIPNLLAIMGMAVPGQGAVAVVGRYLGGDFNVNPTPRGGHAPLTAHAPAYPPGAAGAGTTYSGSMYDYWYADVPAPAPVGLLAAPIPGAHAATLDSGTGAAAAGLLRRMSDHTATLLQIG